MNFDMQRGHQGALSDNSQLGEMDRTLIRMLASRTGADPKKLEADFRLHFRRTARIKSVKFSLTRRKQQPPKKPLKKRFSQTQSAG